MTRFCVECGRPLVVAGDKALAPAVVCDAHVAAGRLLGRRSESTMNILAARHGAQLEVVPAPPVGRGAGSGAGEMGGGGLW